MKFMDSKMKRTRGIVCVQQNCKLKETLVQHEIHSDQGLTLILWAGYLCIKDG